MKLTLNGSIFLSGEEIYFEDLEVEIEEELPFTDIDDYYEENDVEDYLYDECEDCNECEGCKEQTIEFDLTTDERFVEYHPKYIEFLTAVVKSIYDTDFCPYCVADVIDNAIDDFGELDD